MSCDISSLASWCDELQSLIFESTNLKTWNKSHLIIVYNFLYNWICFKHFIENSCICVHEKYYLLFYFYNMLTCFWSYYNAGMFLSPKNFAENLYNFSLKFLSGFIMKPTWVWCFVMLLTWFCSHGCVPNSPLQFF